MIILIITIIKCVLQYCVNLVLHYIHYFNMLIHILSITYDYLTINQINPGLWYKQELDHLLSHDLSDSMLYPSTNIIRTINSTRTSQAKHETTHDEHTKYLINFNPKIAREE